MGKPNIAVSSPSLESVSFCLPLRVVSSILTLFLALSRENASGLYVYIRELRRKRKQTGRLAGGLIWLDGEIKPAHYRVFALRRGD